MGRRNRGQATRTSRLANKLSLNELAFKDRLIEERHRAGLSQRQLAEKLGVAPSTICRMEQHDADLTLSQIRHYAYGIGCEVDFSVLEFEPVASVDSQPGESTQMEKFSFRTTVSKNMDTDSDMRKYYEGWQDGAEYTSMTGDLLTNV